MPAQITSGSVIAFLIRVAILVLLTAASLRKYTNEQIFRNAGGFIIGGGAASLALAVYDLIRAVIGAAGVMDFFADKFSLHLKLLLAAAQLVVGIIIYKSGCRSGCHVPLLISVVICVIGLISVIDCFADPSFLSYFNFVFLFLPIMAMLRQFRDARRRSE